MLSKIIELIISFFQWLFSSSGSTPVQDEDTIPTEGWCGIVVRESGLNVRRDAAHPDLVITLPQGYQLPLVPNSGTIKSFKGSEYNWYQIEHETIATLVNPDGTTDEHDIGLFWVAEGKLVAGEVPTESRLLKLTFQPSCVETTPPTPTPPTSNTLTKVTHPFLGFNIRDYNFIPTPSLPLASISSRDVTVSRAKEVGGTVIRLYLTHEDFTMEQCVGLLGQSLDDLHAKGMKALVCLTEGVSPSRYRLRSDEQWYVDKGIGLAYWHQDEPSCVAAATEVMKRYANHPALLGVQPMNEGSATAYPNHIGSTKDDYDQWLSVMWRIRGIVKSMNANVQYWPGILSVSHVAYQGQDYHQVRDDIYDSGLFDVANFHTYEVSPNSGEWQGERENNITIAYCAARGIPSVADEFMSHNDTYQTFQEFRHKSDEMLELGLTGLMPWGFYEGMDVDTSDSQWGLSRAYTGMNGSNFVPIYQYLQQSWS